MTAKFVCSVFGVEQDVESSSRRGMSEAMSRLASEADTVGKTGRR
jgi:hypothetical protein